MAVSREEGAERHVITIKTRYIRIVIYYVPKIYLGFMSLDAEFIRVIATR